MTETHRDNKKKSPRRKRKSSAFPLILIIVITVAAAGFYLFFLGKGGLQSSQVSPPGIPVSTQEEAQPKGSTPTIKDEAKYQDDNLISPQGGESSESPDQTTAPEAESSEKTNTDSDKEIHKADSQASLDTISDFYSHLDKQEYLKPYQLDAPSEEYFSTLLQKVVNNPPIVTGETDDLFNILQNTAHFFRIVGKKNIFILKAILDREKDSFENVLAEFYKMTFQPELLKQRYNLDIPENALYDYAGFFLNTMGGRLYLFRRDSVSRMAVSYYSILIVDDANNRGTNKHGIDISPAIELLISELENSGSKLRMKEDYLDKLYELKDKYHR